MSSETVSENVHSQEPVGRKKGGKFAHHVHFIVDSPFYPLISVPAESVIASPYKYNISK